MTSPGPSGPDLHGPVTSEKKTHIALSSGLSSGCCVISGKPGHPSEPWFPRLRLGNAPPGLTAPKAGVTYLCATKKAVTIPGNPTAVHQRASSPAPGNQLRDRGTNAGGGTPALPPCRRQTELGGRAVLASSSFLSPRTPGPATPVGLGAALESACSWGAVLGVKLTSCGFPMANGCLRGYQGKVGKGCQPRRVGLGLLTELGSLGSRRG